jgi:hypothetical protein
MQSSAFTKSSRRSHLLSRPFSLTLIPEYLSQAAIETCRQGLSEAKAEAVPDGDDESMGEVEFWTTGLIACIANLGCILTKTGQLVSSKLER